MFRILSTELRYNSVEILGSLAILLTGGLWPIIETRDLSGTTASLAILVLFLQIVAPIVSFRLLGGERQENRLRLFHGLPMQLSSIAVARLLRSLAIPLAALLVASILIAIGVALSGFGYLNRLDNSWVLATLAALSVTSAFLVVFLVDLLGMRVAQFTAAVLAGFLILGSVMSPWLQVQILMPLGDFAETPIGALTVVCAAVAIAVADIFVLRWSIGRQKPGRAFIPWLS